MHTSLSLLRSSPSEVGLDADCVLHFLNAAQEAEIELHSFMVAVHGKVAAEGWWAPYAPCFRHGCYSVTKTFTASAVGFALAEEKIRLNDPFEKFFPEKKKASQDDNLHHLTVHDLLCMACGQTEEVDLSQADDAVSKFMDAPFPNRPGSVFHYNSVASHMLGEIIFRLTGQTLPQYLEPRLFLPLGITDVRWDCTPQGLPMGGWGIHLRTEDFLKMGMLFLQHGIWRGKQVLPKGWAECASSRKIASTGDHAECVQGYCYQMWRDVTPGSYRLDGAYGQFCLVYPEQDAVVAITSASSDTEKLLNLVRTCLLPGITAKPLQKSNADQRLRERLVCLDLKENGKICRSLLEPELNGREIFFQPNSGSLIPESQRYMAFVTKVGIQKLSLQFYGTFCLLCWLEGSQNYTVKIGMNGNYAASEITLPCARDPIFATGFWEKDTFQFVMRAVEEPHSLKVRLTFQQNEVCLSYYDLLAPEPHWTKCRGSLR